MSRAKPRVAIVCDWLDGVGGAEQVLREIHALYPKAPIFTSTYRPKKIDWFETADVRTGWLNVFPTKLRKAIPFLRCIYFGNLDLRDYDLVISCSGAEAKGVKTRKDAVHICYLHAPTQYYWQKYDDYLKDPGFGWLDPLARAMLKLLVGRLRRLDYELAQRPDFFVVPSNYIKDEVKKYYKREAAVIFPPVNVEKFTNEKNILRDGFVTTSRQVPWKRLDLAIKACIRTRQRLTVIGDGSEHGRLVRMAAGHEDIVKFLPTMDVAGIRTELGRAKGYIFPSLEPFGIAPVEALAAGTPVIAFGKGGATDYIVNRGNGILFDEQTAGSLCEAITIFCKMSFSHKVVAQSAERFSRASFRKELLQFVKSQMSE